MRELSSLVGLEVIATDNGKRLGTVAEPLVDLAAGELVGVTLAKTPELQVILAEDISIIGPDAVMIPSSEALRSREEVEEALARARPVLGEPPAVITARAWGTWAACTSTRAPSVSSASRSAAAPSGT
ncbi:MAG: PRC-barrel domain-containing protein [Armatimonadota bacterium]